ncbi:hypothetical protein F5Y07DRAFT_127698 [Xylaria sp. FL0933]|nr:hypothetical protein F5Y07DRAFT_127698 [Xylaria sp. FL0933]
MPFSAVQLFYTSFIILLCGPQDDSHTTMYYVLIPVLANVYSSRFDEVVVSDRYTSQELGSYEFMTRVAKFEITPMLPLSPRNGDVIIRRISLDSTVYFTHYVDYSYSRGSIEAPGSADGALIAIAFHHERFRGHGLTMVIIRHGALDHSHEDSTQGRNCGMLSFKLNPFAFSGKHTREFSVINKKENPTGAIAEEKSRLMSFRNAKEADNYAFFNWEDIAYGKDMALPRDEWMLSFTGIADVYISVERMFLDGYDSDDDDDDSGNAGSHPFVDVLDLVVEKNPDKDDTVEEDCEEYDRDEAPKIRTRRIYGNGRRARRRRG